MLNHKNRLIWQKVFLKKAIAQTPNKKMMVITFI